MADTDERLRADLAHVRRHLSDMHGMLAKMADALERLARLEERYIASSQALGRCFDGIESLQERVGALERAQPVQSLTSHWVLNAVYAACGAAVTLIVHRITKGD